MTAQTFNRDLADIADALGVRPAALTQRFATAREAAEDAFLSVPIRTPRGDEEPGKHDAAVTQAIRADRLRVMTVLKLRLDACASHAASGDGSQRSVDVAAAGPARAGALLGEFKQAHDLFEQRLSEVTGALSRGDLSGATFPRVGAEARIELSARQAELRWILEMLPNPNRCS